MTHPIRTTTATTLPSTLMGSPSRTESFTSGDSSRSSLALAEDFGSLSALHKAHNIFYVLNKVRCQRCCHTGSPKLVGTCSKCKTALWDQLSGQCQVCVAAPDGAAAAAAAKPAATTMRCPADGTLVCDSNECSAQAEFARWPETTGTTVRICKQCVERYNALHDLREKLNEGYASAFSTIVRNRRIDSPIFVDTHMIGTFKNPASGTTLLPTAAGSTSDRSVALVGKELATRARDSWHRDVKMFVLEGAAGGGLSRVAQNVAVMQSFAADALVVHITLSDLATLETPIENLQQLFSLLVRSRSDGSPLLSADDVDLIIKHQVPVMFVLDGYDEVAQLQQQNPRVRDLLKKFVDPTRRSLLRPCDIVVVTTRDEPREAVADGCMLDAVNHVEYWRLQRWSADGIRSYCRAWFETFSTEDSRSAGQINSAIERVVAAALSPELHVWAGLPALVGLLCDIESSVADYDEDQKQQQQKQIQYSPSTLFELLLDTTWMRNRRRLQGRIVDPEINNNSNSKNNPPTTLSRLPRSELNPRPEADLTCVDSHDNDLSFLMNLTLQEASTAMCAWFDEMSLAPKAPVRRINNAVNNNVNDNNNAAAAIIELSKLKLDSLPRWAHIYHLLGLLKADTPLRTGQCNVKFQLDALVSWLAARHILFIESREQLPKFLTTHWSMPGVAEIFVFLADYTRRWTLKESEPSYLKLLEQVFPPDDSSWIGGDETAFCDLAAKSFSIWLQQQGATAANAARNYGPFVRPLLRAAMRLSDPCALLDAVVNTLQASGSPSSFRLFVNLVAEWFAVEGFCDAIKWIEQDLNLLELLDRPATLTLAKLHALDRSKDSIAVCGCLKHLLDNKSVSASLLEAARVVSEVGVISALSEVGVKAALAAARVPAENDSNDYDLDDDNINSSNNNQRENDVRDALIELAAHSKFKLFCTILEAGVGPNAVDVWRRAINAVVSRSGFVRAVLDFAVPPATMQSLPDLQNRIQQQQQQQQQQDHTEQQQRANNEAVVTFSEMKVLINLKVVSRVEVLDEHSVKLTLARNDESTTCQITHVKLIRNRSTVSQPTVVGGSAFDCVWDAAAESLKDLTVSTAEPKKNLDRVSDSEIRGFLIMGRFPNLQSLTLLDEISEFPSCGSNNDNNSIPKHLQQLVVVCGQLSEQAVRNSLGSLLQRVSQHSQSQVTLELRQVKLNEELVCALIEVRAIVHQLRVKPCEKSAVSAELRQALLAYNVTII